jgi:hypothetical protein
VQVSKQAVTVFQSDLPHLAEDFDAVQEFNRPEHCSDVIFCDLASACCPENGELPSATLARAPPGASQTAGQDTSTKRKLNGGQHQLQLAAQGKRLRLDAASRVRWRRLVYDHHVIVATPGELLHGLVQGVITVSTGWGRVSWGIT